MNTYSYYSSWSPHPPPQWPPLQQSPPPMKDLYQNLYYPPQNPYPSFQWPQQAHHPPPPLPQWPPTPVVSPPPPDPQHCVLPPHNVDLYLPPPKDPWFSSHFQYQPSQSLYPPSQCPPQHIPAKPVPDLEMEISVFDGEEDAYWWVLCTEKYFAAQGIPETEKMTVVATAMRGRALKWWLWWYPRHPQVSWDPFTSAFLWRFKPEYRDVLPIFDDAEEPDSESWDSVLIAPDEFLLPTDQIEAFSLDEYREESKTFVTFQKQLCFPQSSQPSLHNLALESSLAPTLMTSLLPDPHCIASIAIASLAPTLPISDINTYPPLISGPPPPPSLKFILPINQQSLSAKIDSPLPTERKGTAQILEQQECNPTVEIPPPDPPDRVVVLSPEPSCSSLFLLFKGISSILPLIVGRSANQLGSSYHSVGNASHGPSTHLHQDFDLLYNIANGCGLSFCWSKSSRLRESHLSYYNHGFIRHTGGDISPNLGAPRCLSMTFGSQSFGDLVRKAVVMRSPCGAISSGRIHSFYIFHWSHDINATKMDSVRINHTYQVKEFVEYGLTLNEVFVCQGTNDSGPLSVPFGYTPVSSSLASGSTFTGVIVSIIIVSCDHSGTSAIQFEFDSVMLQGVSFGSMVNSLNFFWMLPRKLFLNYGGPGWYCTAHFSIDIALILLGIVVVTMPLPFWVKQTNLSYKFSCPILQSVTQKALLSLFLTDVVFAVLVILLSANSLGALAVTVVEMPAVLRLGAQNSKLIMHDIHLIVFPEYSKKWDPGGDCYFSHTVMSLHFKQWDPGGCSLVQRKGATSLHFIIFLGILEVLLSQLLDIRFEMGKCIVHFQHYWLAGTTIGVTIYNWKKIDWTSVVGCFEINHRPTYAYFEDRIGSKSNKSTATFRIHGSCYSPCCSYAFLKACHDHNLEDKVVVDGWSNVTAQVLLAGPRGMLLVSFIKNRKQ